MIRQPPRSTRTDTLFPYTTLFRSVVDTADIAEIGGQREPTVAPARAAARSKMGRVEDRACQPDCRLSGTDALVARELARVGGDMERPVRATKRPLVRSEERRVGKEGVSTCRSTG